MFHRTSSSPVPVARRFFAACARSAVLLSLAVLVTNRVANAQSPVTGRYFLPGDRVFPEGVAYQPSTGAFFVTSTTDGTVFRGNLSERVARPFLPGGADGRTTAVGLKVDDRDRLWIAGGATGRLFVYDATSGALIRRFDLEPGSPTFVNDMAISPSGDAFFTDSQRPFLYRVFEDASGELVFERFLDFTGTALVYTPGFNVNGIAASADGRFLVVVQSNTGRLFRIDIAARTVAPIGLGGATVTNGDGLVLQGRTLLVVRNQQELIVRIDLTDNYAAGRILSEFTDPTFGYPTTAALTPIGLLVVNSQFDRRGPGLVPDLPFTVSGVRLP